MIRKAFDEIRRLFSNSVELVDHLCKTGHLVRRGILVKNALRSSFLDYSCGTLQCCGCSFLVGSSASGLDLLYRSLYVRFDCLIALCSFGTRDDSLLCRLDVCQDEHLQIKFMILSYADGGADTDVSHTNIRKVFYYTDFGKSTLICGFIPLNAIDGTIRQLIKYSYLFQRRTVGRLAAPGADSSFRAFYSSIFLFLLSVLSARDFSRSPEQMHKELFRARLFFFQKGESSYETAENGREAVL